MRSPPELHATVNAEQVKIHGQRLLLHAQVTLKRFMPRQDADLPKLLEAGIGRGGRRLKHRRFRLAVEQAGCDRRIMSAGIPAA